VGKERYFNPFRQGNKEQLMDRFLRNTLPLAGLLLLGTTAQAASVSGQGAWEMTLQGRDLDGDNTTAEAWYDSVLGITWLGDANHARTTGFAANRGGDELGHGQRLGGGSGPVRQWDHRVALANGDG
jgi:hypothetical protein